jgi:rubrerythrin
MTPRWYGFTTKQAAKKQRCPACGSTWTPRTKEPIRCPRCQRPLR